MARIVQIAVTDGGSSGEGLTLVALCNDGTLWTKVGAWSDPKWARIALPDDAAAKEGA